MWAVWVMAALDEADASAEAAGVVVHRDPQLAATLLSQAVSLRATGTATQTSALPSAEEAVAEWNKAHGGSIDDPEVRNKVYKAVAESRRLEAEAAERSAKAAMKAAAGADKLRRRRRRGS